MRCSCRSPLHQPRPPRRKKRSSKKAFCKKRTGSRRCRPAKSCKPPARLRLLQPIIYVASPHGLQGSPGPSGSPGMPGLHGLMRLLESIRVVPLVKRYFYIPASDLSLHTDLRIPAAEFINDEGNPVERLSDSVPSGYWNLYINAVLQEGNIFTASPECLTIVPTGQTIAAGTPIILESVSFQVHYDSNK